MKRAATCPPPPPPDHIHPWLELPVQENLWEKRLLFVLLWYAGRNGMFQ